MEDKGSAKEGSARPSFQSESLSVPAGSGGVTPPLNSADLRMASEAMQKAAEAMIAATESFRRQFNQQEEAFPRQRPVTYHPYNPLPMGEASASQPRMMERNSVDSAPPAKRSHNSTPQLPLPGPYMPPHSRHGSASSFVDAVGPPSLDANAQRMGSYSELPSTMPAGVTPIPAAAQLSEFLPNRPGVPRINTDPAATSFGAQVVPLGQNASIGPQLANNNPYAQYQPYQQQPLYQQQPQLQQQTFVGMTPTTDWPVISGSTPNLASTMVGPSIVPGGPPPTAYRPAGAGAAHVDLFEAANRFKAANGSGAGVGVGPAGSTADLPPPPSFYSSPPSANTPSPVVHVGRYTYVRSDTDDFQNVALINNNNNVNNTAYYDPGPPSPTLLHHGQNYSNNPNGGGGQQQPQQPGLLPPPPPPSADRPHGYSLAHEVMFVGMVCVAQMLMLAGIAQALVPAHIIGASFQGTTFGDMAWYSAAYGLTAGTFVLPSGRLGDLFGHKRMFVLGFLWFGAWSLACGFADRVEQAGGRGTVFFCFSRAMQGIGPSLLVPNGQAMLGRAYKPGKRKNMVMCLFGAAAPLGFVIGAVMSSLFAMQASWPWAFFTLAAVCISLAAVSVLVMPGLEGPTRLNNKESLWSQLDAPGMFLGVSGLVLFNFAFNQAPIVSWNTPYTYFILIIGLMLISAFVYVETVVAHPLVPVSAMSSSTVFVLACTGTGWGCFSIWVFYAFLVLENLRGWSPLLASAAFAHAPLSGLAASLLTGYLMGRIGPPWIMFISMCAFFAGSLLLATAPVDQSYWLNTFFAILVMPFGMDMSNPAATILLSNSVSKEHQGIAASLVVTVVNYSISIALGFAGTIEVNLHLGGQDLLAGYRGAQYFGLGLGGLGVLLGAAFLLKARGKGGPPPMGPPTMKA